MRDKKRIKCILNLIEKIWEKNPDLRLCQLIKNCFHSLPNGKGQCNSIYYVKDKELEKRLKEVYNV